MSLAQKLADRFKPGIFDRLKQSKEAKALRRNVAAPKLVAVDTETQPQRQYTPTGRILESQSIFAEPTGFYRKEQIWREWYADTQITTSSACTTCDNVWNVWHQDTGTSSVVLNTWNTWASNAVTIRTSNIITTGWADEAPYRRPAETAQQRRAREVEEARYRAERDAESARYQEQQRAAENKRKAAEERAMGLLMMMLNDQQRADMKRDKHFFVDAPSGRLYRIDYGSHGNIKVIDRQTRKVVERLCIQPSGVPTGDVNLIQKLMIETAEEAFRAHANITLEDGRVVYGKREPLTGVELAKVIPIRKAA